MLTISGLTYRVGGRHGRALFDEANAIIPDGAKLGVCVVVEPRCIEGEV